MGRRAGTVRRGQEVTTSQELIAEARRLLGEVPIVKKLCDEYEIAIAQNLRLEETIHRLTKDPRI
jgi:hypothetical protein